MSGMQFDLNDEDKTVLYTFPICAHMSHEEAVIFVQHLAGLQYAAGETLFTQGSHLDDHLFIILDGEVEIAARLADLEVPGTSIISQKRGDVVGILSFIDGRKHVASARAKTDVRTAVITRQDYAHFKSRHPHVATCILEFLIVAADNIACQLMAKYIESLDYIRGAMRPRSMP